MTAEEVRKALGYRPFDQFRAARVKLNKAAPPVDVHHRTPARALLRGTGRTTRILCEALARVSEGGSVCVYAESEGETQLLQRQLYDFARKLQLPVNSIVFGAPQPHYNRRDTTFLQDHQTTRFY